MDQDPLAAWEAWIVKTGLRILGILSFLAFLWSAVGHLAGLI